MPVHVYNGKSIVRIYLALLGCILEISENLCDVGRVWFDCKAVVVFLCLIIQLRVAKVIDVLGIQILQAILVDVVIDLIKVSLCHSGVSVYPHILCPLEVQVEKREACIYVSIEGHVVEHLDFFEGSGISFFDGVFYLCFISLVKSILIKVIRACKVIQKVAHIILHVINSIQGLFVSNLLEILRAFPKIALVNQRNLTHKQSPQIILRVLICGSSIQCLP